LLALGSEEPGSVGHFIPLENAFGPTAIPDMIVSGGVKKTRQNKSLGAAPAKETGANSGEMVSLGERSSYLYREAIERNLASAIVFRSGR